MNTQKKLIALLLHTIISFAIIMLIVGCPMDSNNSDNSDTTAPTIVSSVTGKTKVVVTFSEAIKFGSVGNTDGNRFTVEVGTIDSLGAITGITAVISGSMLTLTLGATLTNAQTHVKVEFKDNAIADTAGNILATNATTGVLTVDTTAPILASPRNIIALPDRILIRFNEQITYGSAIGSIYPTNDNVLTILNPLNITVKTGNSIANLNTTKKVAASGIYQINIDSKKTLMLAYETDSLVTVGDYIQVTFGETTITDLVGNALANGTKTGTVQVQASL